MKKIVRNSGSLKIAMTLMLITGIASSARAEAAEDDPGEQEGPMMPDIELLEFLGSFQTDSGEWIDPNSLLSEDFDEFLNLAARMDELANNAENNDVADDQQDN